MLSYKFEIILNYFNFWKTRIVVIDDLQINIFFYTLIAINEREEVLALADDELTK